MSSPTGCSSTKSSLYYIGPASLWNPRCSSSCCCTVFHAGQSFDMNVEGSFLDMKATRESFHRKIRHVPSTNRTLGMHWRRHIPKHHHIKKPWTSNGCLTRQKHSTWLHLQPAMAVYRPRQIPKPPLLPFLHILKQSSQVHCLNARNVPSMRLTQWMMMMGKKYFRAANQQRC